MGRIILSAAVVGLMCQSGAFAESTSVQSLLKDGYAVAGVVPSPAGPGVFLHKGADLIVCFVAETPASAEVATRYCKPVR